VRPTPRLHAAVAALPLTVWACFHLWEQWAVFAGRDPWIERMRATSRGPIAIAIELLVIVAPLAVWAALTIRAALRRERSLLAARDDDAGLVRAIGLLAPIGSVLAIAFLSIHVAHLWGAKVFGGASELELWAMLTHELGRPWMLVLYAIGLTGVALHLVGAIPAALEGLGWISTPAARRSAMLVSAALALAIWILSVQLTGWLGTATGTFWPIEVIEASAASTP
jgi:hypothetical protein